MQGGKLSQLVCIIGSCICLSSLKYCKDHGTMLNDMEVSGMCVNEEICVANANRASHRAVQGGVYLSVR